MRVLRSVLGGCVGIVACVVVLTTLTSTPPTGPAIHAIVPHNLKVSTGVDMEELEGKMTCDEKLLEKLGFVEKPHLYPKHTWENLSTPVLTTAVSSGLVWQVDGLLGMVQQLFSNLTVVVYSLDLSAQELQELEETCNSSCVVTPFDFSTYPSHVRDLHLKAYRPIIIQELLVRAGAVLWLDASVRLISEVQDADMGAERMTEWSGLAVKNGGVLTWPLPHPALLPTAALTHPNMFTFFHTKKNYYDFQQMGDAGTMLVYNTKDVHSHLMKPWVSCALTHNCISPIGAQDTGCRYDKKPLFRYSGCHHYDASAFNVALGVMFSYDTRPYLAATSPFTRVLQKAQEEVENVPGEESMNTSSRDNSSRKYNIKRLGVDTSNSGPSFNIVSQNSDEEKANKL